MPPSIVNSINQNCLLKEGWKIKLHLQSKASSYRALLRFSRFLVPNAGLLGISLFFVLFSSLILLWLGYGLTHFIDQGFRSYADLIRCVEIFGVAIGLRALGSYGELFFLSLLSEKVGMSVRQAVFKKLLTFNGEFYEKNTVGDLLSKLVYEVGLLEAVVVNIIPLFGRNLVIAIGGTILLFLSNQHLALVVVLSFPLILIPVLFFSQWTSKLSNKKLAKKWTTATAHAEEALSGIKTVQAFGQEKLEKEKFTQELAKSMKDSFYHMRLKGIISFISIAIGFCIVAIVLWIGGEQVLSQEMTSGQLTSFVFYALAVVSYLGRIGEGWGALENGKEAAETLNAILEKKNQTPILSLDKNFQKTGSSSEISFKDVTFFHSTSPDKQILNKVNFEVPQGKTVALLGASGSGKTTIFELLLRFCDPVEGEIFLKGHSLQAISLETLRGEIGLISQDSVIFSGTIYENISYGAKDFTEEKVLKAAKEAGVTSFVSEFPEGIHSHVGQRGSFLSSGQRQRIMTARVLLRDPNILLLDEPANFLPASSRDFEWVQKRRKRHRTTLIITHHLSTVKEADFVIVLERGKVTAMGTHKELLKKSKLYKILTEETLVQD